MWKFRRIDLDALEQAVGRCPRRYDRGNVYNGRRAAWMRHALAGLHALVERTDKLFSERPATRSVADPEEVSCRPLDLAPRPRNSGRHAAPKSEAL